MLEAYWNEEKLAHLRMYNFELFALQAVQASSGINTIVKKKTLTVTMLAYFRLMYPVKCACAHPADADFTGISTTSKANISEIHCCWLVYPFLTSDCFKLWLLMSPPATVVLWSHESMTTRKWDELAC